VSTSEIIWRSSFDPNNPDCLDQNTTGVVGDATALPLNRARNNTRLNLKSLAILCGGKSVLPEKLFRSEFMAFK